MSPAPTLLRRATPAPAATPAAAAAAPASSAAAPGSPLGTSSSPRFPPGFSSPRFLRPDLVASLFPQLVAAAPDLQPQVAPPLPTAVEAAPKVSDLPRKVSFDLNAELLEDTPPPPVHGAHRPCLKSAPAASFKSGAWRARWSATSSPAPSKESSQVSSGDKWHLVRPAYWWREGRSNHRNLCRRSAGSYSPPRHKDFVKLQDRECHRCLLKGHCQVDCRNPLTCRRCRRFGHRARGCTNALSPSPLSPSSPPKAAAAVPLRLPSPPAAPLPCAMSRREPRREPRVGDPALRPEEGRVVIISTSKFSYCLFYHGQSSAKHGFLRFGSDVPNHDHAHSTPLMYYETPLYYIGLEGVGLNGEMLTRINPGMFKRDLPSNRGGTIVDVGTPATRMIRAAYDILEAAVIADLHHRLGVSRAGYRVPGSRLCFIVSIQGIYQKLPSITLYLRGGAELTIKWELLFVTKMHHGAQHACFLIFPDEKRTVLGAAQQVDTRFTFDIDHNRLYFAPENCENDSS